MSKDKTPPILSQCKSYDDWVKLLGIWRDFTSLDKSKQGLAVVLSLQEKAQEAVLEIPKEDLAKEDGIDTIIKRLDEIYKKDELSQKFNALETFEGFHRKNASIREYITEFEKLYYKVKSHGITVSDDILGFKLLKSASLSERDEQLIKATVKDLKFDEVKDKLSKIFSDQGASVSLSAIKQEETFHAQQEFYEEDTTSEYTDFYEIDQETPDNIHTNTFYTNSRYNGANNRRGVKFKSQPPPTKNRASNYNWRKPETQYRQPETQYRQPETQYRQPSINRKGKNPPGRSGFPTRCAICQSINHWAQYCPDRDDNEHETLFVESEIVLLQKHFNNGSELKSLVAETWSTALLDCGASKTVCGQEWFNQYILTLSADDRNMISKSKSNSIYRFGDGNKVIAKECVIIPATIGTKKVFIETDIVENDLPLLLSRASMKKANMQLNFEDDTVIAFDNKIPLINTSSGHYAIPISQPVQIITKFDKGQLPNLTLKVQCEKSEKEVAKKLHRQFAHPPEGKLLSLIENAGHPWSTNQKLKEEISIISGECEICQRYKKPLPRPVVGLPTATNFQDTVALDIKFYNGRMLLHMIDHLTRLSSASVIPNKNPETIVKHMLKYWISVYGSAGSFLSDNGGEFINKPFIELCEQFGIYVKTTAAESPWSNGLIERHNLIIAEMIDKVMADTNCNLEVALAWCINAKNSLQNVHGFSPFQLAIGTNPKLPSVLTDKLPALSAPPTTKIIKDNLEALHKARQAFIEAQNSEKIRRALSHNIRTSGDVKYINGDSVFYKRLNSREWHGPAKVLAQDGQQVLLKHGGVYVRVHPCRLQLTRAINNAKMDDEREKDKEIISTRNIQKDANEEDSEEEPLPQVTSTVATSIQAACVQNKELQLEKQNEETSGMAAREEMNDRDTLNMIKPKTKIKFKEDDDSWTSATVISRAGKSTGKYAHWWNIQCNDERSSRDLSDVKQLQIDENNQYLTTTESVFFDALLTNFSQDEITEAKKQELGQWREQNVYTEVDFSDQDPISLRWVLQQKTIDGKAKVKARLCARGFEEEQLFRTDSPTCSREGVRIALSTIASNCWKLNSIDVKAAFLQGKEIQREVYVKPPKEANSSHLWKLNKCIYGLSDASRYWYLKLKDELIKLGGILCQYDQGIFCWIRNGKLYGLAICFVDDILWGGEPEFYDIIKQLKSTFTIGTENESTFRYIGIDLRQQEDFSIIADQKSYINAINTIPLTSSQKANIEQPLNKSELKSFRSSLGQLNWIAGMTRPEISFYTCELSTHIKNAKIEDIIAVNKVIKYVKNNPSYIKFQKLDLNSLHLDIFTDASWNNLPNGGSQGGQIIFLSDKNNSSSPIYWNSTRLRRVARSTLAAESLSLSEGSDSGFFISNLIENILHNNKKIPMKVFTDNLSLHDTAKSSKTILEKRLRVEISAIREMCEKEEIDLIWLEKEKQVADVLTKKGASSDLLRQTLKEGAVRAVFQ